MVLCIINARSIKGPVLRLRFAPTDLNKIPNGQRREKMWCVFLTKVLMLGVSPCLFAIWFPQMLSVSMKKHKTNLFTAFQSAV